MVKRHFGLLLFFEQRLIVINIRLLQCYEGDISREMYVWLLPYGSILIRLNIYGKGCVQAPLAYRQRPALCRPSNLAAVCASIIVTTLSTPYRIVSYRY